MKTITSNFLIFILLCLPFFSSAQWINSLTVLPANPTTTDTITVIAVSSFPSGGCNQKTLNFFVSPPTISAYALHCLGPLAVICNDSDFFMIPPLSAGNYTFTYQVSAGSGPWPCTPGIVPGPVDSINIHVTNVTGMPLQPAAQNDIRFYPGKNNGSFIISLPTSYQLPALFHIYTVTGQRIKTIRVTSSEQELDLSYLDAGIYFIKQYENESSYRAVKFVIKK